MNVASRELCKELYELSGWRGDTNFFPVKYSTDDPITAYDLGYLLRKLPVTVNGGWFGAWKNAAGNYTCGYVDEDGKIIGGNTNAELFEAADTPEDAAAKLAIELFKQGMLKKEQS